MARTFQVSFKINGAMDGSLQAALQAAANAMRGLGNAARQASSAAQASRGGLAGLAAGLNQLQQAAQRYKQVQDALKQTTADMSKATQNLRSAREKYAADTAAVEQLKQKLQQLKTAQAELGTKKSAGNASLKQLRQDLQGLKQAYAEAKRAGDQMKMSQLGSQIKSTQGAITSQQEAVRKAAQAYKELSDKVKQTKADLQAAQAAQTASGRGLSSAQSDAQRLAASYKSQQAALNALKASLSAAGFNTSNFAASESRLAADIDRVNSALRQQQALTNAQNQSAQASQNMFNAYNNFQGAIQTAQQVAAPFQAAAENAMNFEYAMSKVKSLTQMRNIRSGNLEKVREEMAALTKQAEMLGATTEFTSQEVAEAMGKYGMAGWDATRIQNAMQSTIDLATIEGDHNIQRMADVLSDDMTAMGLKAGEMLTLQTGKQVESSSYFADAFAYALTNANVNRESLHEALKYNAPIAKQWGLSLGEEFAVNMMSANAGIKGSMAGTGLRAGLLRISAPPKKAAAAFAEMGLSMSDAQKELAEGQAAMKAYGVTIGDFRTTLTSLSDVYNKLDRGERLGFVDAVFGKNASSFWANILDKGNVADVLKAAGEIDTGYAEGWAAETASVMRDNTKTSVELLKSSIDALQRSVGDALTPAIRSAADAFSPMVTAASEFIAQNPAIVQGATAIAAALATIVVGAAAVKLAFAGWTFITSTVALVQTALASLGSGAMFSGLIARISLLRTALLSLTAAGGLATTGGWATMFTAISTKATAAATAIRAFFASLTLGSAASGIAATLSSIGTAIAGAARAAMAFAFSPVGVALMALGLAGMYVYQNWSTIGPVFSNIAGIITGALGPAITQIQAAFSALSSSGALSSLGSAASQLASVVGGTLVKAFAVLATVVASALAVAIRAIADFVTFASEAFTGVLDVFGKLSEGDFSGAWEAWQSHGSKAIENIKNLGSHVFDGVEQGAKNVQQTLDVLNGKVTVAQQNALKQAPSSAPQFDDPMMNAAQVAQPPIDTSQTQAALDQVGNSAQQAATNMDGVNQATQQISQAGADVQQFGAGMQTASTGVQQFGTSAQTASTGVQQLLSNAIAAGTGVQELGSNAQAAGGGITSLSDAASGATGGVSALGSAASGAAGSVSGLGAAVQAACSQLAAAGANAAAAVASAAPAKNAQGGIYKKGAFLTTFAEESPEAAIPINRSQRAIDLWTQTGQMLGQLPGNANSYDTVERDELGNIKGLDIPEHNRITEYDSTQFRRSKRIAQEKQFAAQQAAMRQAAKFAAENLQQATQAMSQATTQATTEAVTEAATSTNYADMVTDELGNIKGLDIPEFNRITEYDSTQFRRSKRIAQEKQLAAQRAALQQAAIQPAATSNVLPQRPQLSAASERRLNAQPPVQSPLSSNRPSMFEGLRSGLSSPQSSGSSSPITFSVNVTVNGNANADEVKRGVEQAIPSLEDFAQKIQSLKHEAARRSFA